MKYYKEIKTKEGFTLSIDMVTIDYSISSSAARDELAKILDNLPLCMLWRSGTGVHLESGPFVKTLY